jgi:hypothetical protein
MIAAFARLLPARHRRGLIVTPFTILRWHRQLLNLRPSPATPQLRSTTSNDTTSSAD